MANVAMAHFRARGNGHLVGISSIAGLRGYRNAPAYNASKTFESRYLEGLRLQACYDGLPITVTDILPGFVDTPMTQGQQGMFWVASPQEAAWQIADVIKKKKRRAYISRRWVIMARLYQLIPDWLFEWSVRRKSDG